jgi:hypothetical protein
LEELETAATQYLITMELILFAGLVILLLAVGLIKLIETATHREFKLDAERRTGKPSQPMLFMSSALEVSDKLTRQLQAKTEQRSLEIAKADDRFLVTLEDMKKAYDEIVREEHM